MTPQTIAIIPARGGSKGIPRKNIRLLGGKPLIAWSIEAAKNSGVVDLVIVSTEDEEIAEISRKWGAEVPFMRPVELATDTSSLGDAVNHAVRYLVETERSKVDIILTLLPTHPFQKPEMLQVAVEVLQDDDYRTFSTVARVWCPPGKIVLRRGDYLQPISTQDRGLPHVYYRNYGLINGRKLDCYYGRDYAFVVSDRFSLVDIDTMDDLNAAEALLGLKKVAGRDH